MEELRVGNRAIAGVFIHLPSEYFNSSNVNALPSGRNPFLARLAPRVAPWGVASPKVLSGIHPFVGLARSKQEQRRGYQLWATSLCTSGTE
jgi:hypothetical protein